MSKFPKKKLMILKILIILIQISQIQNSQFSIRNLLDSPSVQKVCDRSSKEVKEFFESGGHSLQDKEYEDNEEHIQKLIDLIEGKGDKDEATQKYLEHLSVTLFFIAFGIVSIIIWPVCICCTCCRFCNYFVRCFFYCCPLKFKKTLTKILFFTTIGAYALGTGFALYGTIKSYSIFDSLDNASCSIFKMIIETVNGQETNNRPKWSGINGVNQILINLGNAVTDSMTNYKEAFKRAKENMDTQISDWETNLESVYDNIISNKFDITGPSIKSSTNTITAKDYSDIIPDYVYNLGPYIKSKTTFYQLNEEYKLLTQGIFFLLNRVYNIVDESLTDKVSGKLKNTTNEISSLGENFDKLTEDIADPWMNIQDKIIEIGEKLSKAIFTINFIFSAIIITLLFFHYFEFLKALFCLFKIFYYISWNLLFLFSIIIFILSGLIGIIGIFGRDCASVGHYIFSDNNLKSETPRILKNGKSSEYLNVCINGNGDLKTAFGFDDSMDKLDELYNYGDDIRQFQSNISTKTTSLVISAFQINEYSTKYLNHKYVDLSGNDQNFDSFLEEMNKYISKSGSTSYQSTSSPIYDDIFSKLKVANGYTYLSPSNTAATSNEKKLLYLYDNWTPLILEQRYENIDTNGLGGYGKVNTGVSSIKTILDDLKEKNSNIYTIVSTQLTTLNTKYSSIMNIVINTLIAAAKAIDPLSKAIQDFLGQENNSIYSLMNCAFIGYDVKFLLKQLHDGLGKSFYTFASCMICMAVFLTLGLYCTVLYSIYSKDMFFEEEKSKNENDDYERSSFKSYNGETGKN